MVLIAVAILLGGTAGATASSPRVTVAHSVPHSGTLGHNDYPYQNAINCQSTYGPDSWCIDGNDISPLGFAYRNCTDFAAWRVGITWASFIRHGDGNAVGWKQAAINDGYTVSSTPVVGAVAWWPGGLGHVAVVLSLNGDGSVNVEQYNQQNTGVYSQQSSVRADAYLYINVGVPSPSGSFVRDTSTGEIDEVIGGSLVGIPTETDCNSLNCSADLAEWTDSEFRAYKAEHPTIANNTFIRNAEGTIFQAVGGTLLGIPTGSDCTALDCGNGAIQSEDDMINGYQSAHPTIANNTFIRNAEGTIFQAVGGTLLGIPTGSDCTALDCGNGAIQSEDDMINGYQSAHPTIANNTFIRNAEGTIFQAVGGTLLGIPTGSDCTALDCGNGAIQSEDDMINGYQSAHPTIANNTFIRNAEGTIFQAVGGTLLGIPTGSDCTALDCGNGAIQSEDDMINGYQSAHPTIANNTFIRNAEGTIFQAVGGTLLGIPTGSDCTALDCGNGAIQSEDDMINGYQSAHPTIANNTFIRNAEGTIFQAVGGTLLGIPTGSDCTALDCGNGAIQSEDDMINGYQSAHGVPASGTVVQGTPSGGYWIFEFGGLLATSSSTSALIVCDDMLQAFPIDHAPESPVPR